MLALAPGEIETLQRNAIAVFLDKKYEDASRLFQILIALEAARPSDVLCEVICRAQVGDGRTARSLFDFICTAMAKIPQSTEARDALDELMRQTEEYLPGGAQDPQALDALRASAERMLPRRPAEPRITPKVRKSSR